MISILTVAAKIRANLKPVTLQTHILITVSSAVQSKLRPTTSHSLDNPVCD